MGKNLFFILILLVGVFPGLSQEKQSEWSINGYNKSLQSFYVQETLDNVFIDLLIHNRLNFDFYSGKKFHFNLELRNRIITGDGVRFVPDYGTSLDNDSNDAIDLSVLIIDKNSLVFHSVLDRLYAEFYNDKWEIRLGRQRVNWGISTLWNPNDIFNAYSFTDFDYEERPGSDALRIKHFTGFASSAELALKYFDDWDEAIVAGMWKFNKGSYDIQLLAGKMGKQVAIGTGWAGNIKTASFKGETTYFISKNDEKNSIALAAGIDYSFKSGFYINQGFLFNSNGSSSVSIEDLFTFELSAQNLYPYKYNILSQVSYPISPLSTGSIAIVYSPSKTHSLFINPVFTYSISSNWDFDFVGQIVFSKEEKYRSPVQGFFLRFKMSY